MSRLPKQCIVDTNVPKVANRALAPDKIPQELTGCVLSCIEAVEHVINKGNLVIDAGGDIFDEYRQQLSMKGQPGMGDKFLKWVHDHQWKISEIDRVKITKTDGQYDQFPEHDGLKKFDLSDRKFVAVANAHPDKPTILQATDSKWWGWKEALAEVGIHVHFVCPDYIKAKYAEKMEK